MKINYLEMVDYYKNIIDNIRSIQGKIINWKWNGESEPSEELLENANKDSMDCYASFDRAYYRLCDVMELIEFEDEPDFQAYALENIRGAKYRIKHFLDDAKLEYPKYDLNQYDDILEDYYDNMDFNENAYDKYLNITYLRSNINLGICHDIDYCYELYASKHFDDIREENYRILDEIVVLVKKLYGFKEPSKGDIINERWIE